jgi:hypothetical protein
MRIATLACLGLLAAPATGAQEVGWIDESGNPAAPTASQGSIEGFGGWLLVTSDGDWAERWTNPAGSAPSFTEAGTVRVGEEVFTLVMFANPAVDADGNATVLCNLRVTRPDGTLSIDEKEATCFRGKMAEPMALYLSELVVGFVGEPRDPRGEWLVEVRLNDVTRKVELPLRTSFVLE